MTSKLIYSLLKNNTTLSAILEGRVYPLVIPQAEAIDNSAVYRHRIELDEQNSCDGYEMFVETFWLYFHSSSYTTLTTLVTAFVDALPLLRGLSADGVKVSEAKRQTIDFDYEKDFRVFFSEIKIELTTSKILQ